MDPQSDQEPDASPEAMIFGENLDEFAARVANICALEQGGQIAQLEAYRRIKALYKQLRTSKRNLLTPEPPPE
ncbi:MAG: hypothetical protein AAF797_03280 [Planctomycetota bacterium]